MSLPKGKRRGLERETDSPDNASSGYSPLVLIEQALKYSRKIPQLGKIEAPKEKLPFSMKSYTMGVNHQKLF